MDLIKQDVGSFKLTLRGAEPFRGEPERRNPLIEEELPRTVRDHRPAILYAPHGSKPDQGSD